MSTDSVQNASTEVEARIAWDPTSAATYQQDKKLADVFRLDTRRRSFTLPANHWQNSALQTILRLVQLPENWNSYGAQRIRYDTALFSLLVLDNIMQPGLPLPAIVPTASGGIQLEWHERGIDLEINVLAPNRCRYWFEDERHELRPEEGELDNNFLDLQRPLSLIASREPPLLRRA